MCYILLLLVFVDVGVLDALYVVYVISLENTAYNDKVFPLAVLVTNTSLDASLSSLQPKKEYPDLVGVNVVGDNTVLP